MSGDSASNTHAHAKRALLAVTLINLFNYLDRYVVSALAGSLKEALTLSDGQLGSLMSGFIVVYMATSPVFGVLGDRYSRPRLIAVGVAVWSVATAVAGFSRSFVQLFVARSLVGVGEAAFGTISPGLLADFFPKEQRGRVFALFFMAIPVGSALGFIVGGLVDQAAGWRAAFFIAGVPGLLLALWCMYLYDPPRGAQDDATAVSGQPFLRAYLSFCTNRSYVLAVLGYAAYTFALGGLAYWMPSFLERVRGVPRAQATVQFGAVVVVTGLVGTLVGGWVGDRLYRRVGQAYLWLCGVATLAAVPLAWLVFNVEGEVAYLASLTAAQLLLFASTGPINSAIVNAIAPGDRAKAVGLSIFVMHALGDVPSPLVIGLLADASSLAKAMEIVLVAIALAGLVWTFGALWPSRAPAVAA